MEGIDSWQENEQGHVSPEAYTDVKFFYTYDASSQYMCEYFCSTHWGLQCFFLHFSLMSTWQKQDINDSVTFNFLTF